MYSPASQSGYHPLMAPPMHPQPGSHGVPLYPPMSMYNGYPPQQLSYMHPLHAPPPAPMHPLHQVPSQVMYQSPYGMYPPPCQPYGYSMQPHHLPHYAPGGVMMQPVLRPNMPLPPPPSSSHHLHFSGGSSSPNSHPSSAGVSPDLGSMQLKGHAAGGAQQQGRIPKPHKGTSCHRTCCTTTASGVSCSCADPSLLSMLFRSSECKNTKPLKKLAHCSHQFNKRTKPEKRTCRKKYVSRQGVRVLRGWG